MSVLHVSLPDVALLARVRRAPVSVWRTRYTRSSTPFPEPATVRGNQELFDGDQVVDWLETTGLGKNPDARADLAAFAALADAPLDDDVVFAGVTALLCLTRVNGSLPMDANDLLDLADEVDPDDEYLYAEIAALGGRAAPLAQYTDLLVDASYNPAAAFEELTARRARRSRTGHARTRLTQPALHLVASLALALTTQAEIATPLYVDPAPGSSDLLVELAARAGERGAVAIATPVAAGPEGRLALRRIRVHDIVREPLREDGHGGFVVPTDAVLLVQLPSPDRPDMSDLDVLRAINDLALGSSDRQRAVVIGPSGALTDRLPPGHPDTAAASAVRDDLLRTGRVRGVVRLPAGLLPSRSRARLTVWCLGPAPHEHFAPAGAEARTVVADLANTTLDDTVMAELVTDLVAGMQGVKAFTAHEPRFARPVLTRRLQARTGDLVEPVPVPTGAAETAMLLGRISALTSAIATMPTPPTVPPPVPRSVAPGAVLTVGAAVERGDLRVLPGLRLLPEHLTTDAAVRVIGPPELGAGPGASGRTVDRLVLAAGYPASSYTEPGDVVFCTAPRPAAMVDEGGAVVVFPAKVLRSRTARLRPRVLAADINAQPPGAKTWRAWTVRAVPEDQADALTDALDQLALHRSELADRLDTVVQLAAALVQGAAAGTLDLIQHQH